MAEIAYNPVILGADIRAVGTSILITGTNGGIADIIVNGYTFETNITGTVFNIPDIKFIPLTQGGTFNFINVQLPSDVHPTMKNNTKLDPVIISSQPYANSAYTPQFEMSFDHLFLSGKLSTDVWLARIHLANLTGQTYMPQRTLTWLYNKFTGMFTVYDDITAYTLEYASIDDDNMEIRKVDFCEGISTSELIYSFSKTQTFGGKNYIIWDFLFMLNCQYNGTDCIVFAFTLLKDEVGEDSSNVLGTIIHDVNTGSNTLIITDLSTAGINFGWLASHTSSPSILEDKIVFVANPTTIYDDPLPTNACPVPIFIINCTNKSVSRIDTYEINPSSDWIELDTDALASVIDFTTGGKEKFYFIGWTTASSFYNLYVLDLDVNTLQVSSVNVGLLFLHQNYPDCYAVDLSSFDIKSIPGLSGKGSLSNLFNGESAVIDTANGKIWNILETNGNFEGKSLFGDPITYVITKWTGGNIPFTYSLGRKIYLRLLAGKLMMLIKSYQTSPNLYQNDFYCLSYSCG